MEKVRKELSRPVSSHNVNNKGSRGFGRTDKRREKVELSNKSTKRYQHFQNKQILPLQKRITSGSGRMTLPSDTVILTTQFFRLTEFKKLSRTEKVDTTLIIDNQKAAPKSFH